MPPPVAPSSSGGGRGGTTLWVLPAIAAFVAWAIGMPVFVRRFTRTGATPTEQVVSAWHGTVGALQMAGAPPPAGATPIEYAVQVEREMAVDHRSLLELARFVTRAIYSPAGVGEPAALRAAVLRTHLDESSRSLMPWYTRLQTRIDPRSVRQRLVGDRIRRSRRRRRRHTRLSARSGRRPVAGAVSQSVWSRRPAPEALRRSAATWRMASSPRARTCRSASTTAAIAPEERSEGQVRADGQQQDAQGDGERHHR